MQEAQPTEKSYWLDEKIIANAFILFLLVVWWGSWLPYLKLILLLLILLFLIDCTWLLRNYERRAHLMKLLALFVFGAGLRIGGIRANPPLSDIYLLSDMEVENILRGINPYLGTYPDFPGPLPYPPLSFILYIPMKLIGGDLRYPLAIFDICTAALLFYYFRSSRLFSLMVPGFFLLNPYSRFMIAYPYVEVMLSFFLLASFIAFELRPKSLVSPIMASMSLATKQLAIFFVPFLFFKYDYKRKICFLISTLAIHLPFLFPDPRPLLISLSLYSSPYASTFLRQDTTSFFRIFFWIYGTEIPPLLFYGFTILQLVIPALIMVFLIPKAKDPKQLSFFSIFACFLGLILSPYSMVNYFYMALALIPYALIPRDTSLAFLERGR